MSSPTAVDTAWPEVRDQANAVVLRYCTVEIAAGPTAEIAAGSSGEMRLRVTPTQAAWSFSASLANDDTDEASYAWSATGTASDPSTGGSDGGAPSSGGSGGCGAGAIGGLLLALLLGAMRASQPLSASAMRRPISR